MSSAEQKVVIIGAGAAGYFAAITCASHSPNSKVIILEKSSKILSKVKVSGGGRCNVTHSCFNIKEMYSKYPRGEKALSKIFNSFFTTDTIDWFQSKGVKLKAEPDGRMFPITDSSQTIIDCLVKEADRLGVLVKLNTDVVKIQKEGKGFELTTASGNIIECDKVLIAAGGSPKEKSYDWLKELGHTIQSPVPSLFTFNVKGNEITSLMGVSVNPVQVKIAGTKLMETGPVLITHWGFSGPAVLKLSAWGARALADKNYQFLFMINWIPEYNQEEVRSNLMSLKNKNEGKVIPSAYPKISKRLWEFFLSKAKIPVTSRWAEISNKQINSLVEILTADQYTADGKTTFKEEFVTCGGIDLLDIDLTTMESKKCKGLYFAGEVLDIDGITGGFNFQAAWSTGYVAGKSMALSKSN